MICEKCGTELKDGSKFCIKCGNKFISQNGMQLNKLAVTSIIVIAIGLILGIALKWFNLANESNNWGIIVGRLDFGWLREIALGGGTILALISVYKAKNKLSLIAGIFAASFWPLMSLLYIFTGK